tara:strand:- start:309 stop:1298 length:990 start_codon:yes stop_codon:yes gene_type:complete
MSILGVKKTNIGEFFDGWYDGKFSANYAGYIESMQLEEVLDSIPLSIQDILDHGCGQGSWIHLLQDKFLNAKITSIDISKNGIDVTKKLFPKHTFLFFDGETAPLTDNSYDLIFSYHVLDAVWDLNKSLLDISRLLKKGGYLVIVVPCANENSFEEKITRLVKEGKEKSIDDYERFFYSYSANVRIMKSNEIIELLLKYNFRVYKEFYSCQFWGAINEISKSSFSFINELFDYRRGVNINAKIKLFLLRVIFVTIFCFVKLSSVRNVIILDKVKMSENLIKKLTFFSFFLFKPISMIFGGILSLFSFIEWKLRKNEKNGSGQYLVFKKL